jgi:hypothetical protein
MTLDRTYSVNDDSARLTTAIAPCVASFGCTVHDVTPPRAWSSSCFFVVVNQHLLMCTAAHVIDEILEVMKSGVVLDHWHINDVFTKPSGALVYPFDVMERERLYLREDTLGLDYCLIYVDWLTTENVQHSGVRAITAERTADAAEADKLVLTGFASDYTKKNGASISQRHYVLGVTEIERPQNWNPDQNQRSIFGLLDTAESEELNVLDIGGMSGGPIFGLIKQEDGSSLIRLVAIQSGWSQERRIITACPIGPFLAAVERLIAESNADDAAAETPP